MFFKKIEGWLVFALTSLAGTALMTLVLITCVDVFGRWLFNKPLAGSTELTELGLAIVVFSSLPFVCWRENNIVVDILDSQISPFISKVRSIIIHIISAVCLAFIGQRLFVLGNRSLSYGDTTEHLSIPLGWIVLFMAIICWLSTLCLLSFGVIHSLKSFIDEDVDKVADENILQNEDKRKA